MKISNQSVIGKNLSNIDSTKNNPLDSKSVKDGNAAGVTQAEAKSAASVSMSEDVQRMNKAKEIASKDSVDDAKVARLQKMIDSGEYSVNASAIADRMVDEHLLMND